MSCQLLVCSIFLLTLSTVILATQDPNRTKCHDIYVKCKPRNQPLCVTDNVFRCHRMFKSACDLELNKCFYYGDYTPVSMKSCEDNYCSHEKSSEYIVHMYELLRGWK